MASYNELNALIDAYINRNGVQAITGQILNGVLKAMVEQLGRGYTIMGAAIPTTDPGTPDGPECYFASETGTYTDFDGLQVAPGELALLCYTPSDGWTKATIYEGFQEVGATIDGNVGTPSVGVSYAGGVLSFDFHNMKGNPGQNGQDGAAAGFGTIGADITGGVGTPGVSVESSGPATAKNLQFHFTNLKGETGVTSVVATVDNTTGTPACTVSLVGQQLTLAFSGLKGAQGDTGSSVDYPFTIVNNLTTDDATQALSAAQGVVLEGEITQLEAEVDDLFGDTQDTDFEIADEEGFAIVRFSNGDFETKNFKSKDIVKIGETTQNFAISDENGNDILQIVGGHIVTKNFDSRKIGGTNSKQVLCIGDSLTYQTGSVNYLGQDVPQAAQYRYAQWMGTKNSEYSFIALAVGGENSATILGRIGSVPMVLGADVTLPANGTDVQVSLKSSWIDSTNAQRDVSPLVGGSTPAEQINPCFVGGIECTLTRSNDNYYLRRDEVSQSADVLLKGTCIKTLDSYNYKPEVLVFWMGTNDDADFTAEEEIAKIKQTARFFNTEYFVVLNRHYLTETYTLGIAETYEKKFLDAFGNQFLNWRYYASTRGIYDAIDRGYIDNTGNTYPTAGDLEDMASGTVPRTLRRDAVHLVLEGNKLVGDLIYKRLEELNYL